MSLPKARKETAKHKVMREKITKFMVSGPRMSPEDKCQLMYGRNGLPDYEETRVFTPCPSCGHDISSCRETHRCVQY